MGVLILIGIVLVVAGIVKALDISSARAMNPRRPRARHARDPYAGASIYYYNDSSSSAGCDDHTRNTGSATSWDASDSHSAPSDSGSYDGGGGYDGGDGGCDGGSSD